jgi:hypothetical protein
MVMRTSHWIHRWIIPAVFAVTVFTAPGIRLFSRPVGDSPQTAHTSKQLNEGDSLPRSFLSGGIGWHEIPNTKLQVSHGINPTPAICPPNGFGGTDYDFSDHCANVYIAWNSGAWDEKNERMLMFGGGHGDYAGNEIYALRIKQDVPDLVRLTDPTVPLSSHSYAYIPDNCEGKACRPNSRHTYGGIEVIPTTNELFIEGGAAFSTGQRMIDNWTFDLGSCIKPVAGGTQVDACLWTRHDTCGAGIEGSSCGKMTVPTNYSDQSFLAYDSRDDRVYSWFPSGGEFWSYEPTRHVWKFLSRAINDRISNSHMAATIDPKNHAYVAIGGGRITVVSLKGGYGLSDRELDYGGIAYDAVDQKIVLISQHMDHVYVLDTTSGRCSTESYAGGPSDPTVHGVFGPIGRWRYSRKEDAFVTCPDPYQDCYYLRRPRAEK